MKNKVKLIYILTVTVVSLNFASAQNTEIEYLKATKNELILPPLKNVIDSVLKHSAMLRFRNQEITSSEYSVKSERAYWTRNLGIQGDTRYGTFNSLLANSDGTTASAVASTSRQFNYGAGFYIKFPLFDAINRRNQIQIAKLQLEQAKSMSEVQAESIRQIVIKQYEEIVLNQKLLGIRSQNLGNARVNMEMIEKEFRNGVIAIGEYARISDMTSRIESDYELAKSNFLLSKKILEDMAGFSFDINQSK